MRRVFSFHQQRLGFCLLGPAILVCFLCIIMLTRFSMSPICCRYLSKPGTGIHISLPLFMSSTRAYVLLITRDLFLNAVERSSEP
jgi:hypothetical protein